MYNGLTQLVLLERIDVNCLVLKLVSRIGLYISIISIRLHITLQEKVWVDVCIVKLYTLA